MQNNDKIGVIFFSDRIEKYIPPKKGTKHILYIIREMLNFQPQSQRTDIGCALEYFTRVMKRHCTAFVISDFYSAMTERVIFVCGFGCHFKSHQRHYRRACVGQVIEGVRHNGHSP